ncbi:MAG: hypothetical protein ACI4I5_05950 [Acutalibacteraceae bacterium]
MYEIQNKEYFEEIEEEISGIKNGFLYYCPICGNVSGVINIGNKTIQCGHCMQTVTFKRSNRTWIYYADVAVSKYGSHMRKYLHKVLVDEEASKNPEFCQDMYDFEPSAEQIEDMVRGIIKKTQENNQNVPKCPTCGSTNIESISFSKRAANTVLFGLVSKTARSQFHCKSCGYKW